MIDLKFVREFPDRFDAMMVARGMPPCAQEIIARDQARRNTTTEMQSLQQQKNNVVKQIACNKSSEEKDTLIAQSKRLEAELHRKKEALEKDELNQFLAAIPNTISEKTPIGKDASDNPMISNWGEKPEFQFTPEHHYEIGVANDLLDFQCTNMVSGNRFSTLKGQLAKLERALINFMLNHHTEQYGFQELSVPYLVKDDAMYNTGQLPKFAEDAFRTEDGYYLIPTGEVPLINLFRDSIIKDLDKPIRVTAQTPCFRREAGSTGSCNRGLIRQHQFRKVEMISITKPEDSYQELEYITRAAKSVLQKLELPYRVITLCSGDIGFSAAFTYDIEVWMPHQNCYREISSCSNCEAFQARRAKIRYKEKDKNQLVHTLNGSGLAIGRTIAAIMENYQHQDGSISIPKVLREAMNAERIEA